MDSASLVSVGCGMVALAFILCLPQARSGRRCSTPHLQLPTGGPLLADSANSGHPLANGSHRRCATGLCSSKRSFPPRLNTKCGWSQSAVCLPDFLQDLDASVLSHPLHCSLKKLTASLSATASLPCISPTFSSGRLFFSSTKIPQPRLSARPRHRHAELSQIFF